MSNGLLRKHCKRPRLERNNNTQGLILIIQLRDERALCQKWVLDLRVVTTWLLFQRTPEDLLTDHISGKWEENSDLVMMYIKC